MSRFTLSELEDYIRSIDAAAYTRRRNYIGGSTNLSEYITRGAISLPRIRELLLENNSPEASLKLINELAWREYWQLVWNVRGDDIFEYIRPLPTTPRNGLPQAILDANTGIKALDDGIKQLQTTGYIHNHMRMWLAGLICNVAQCDWKVGAAWMHAQLIDGDYASNHLSWQWVAGSYTGKPYLPQQDNINEFTNTVQHGTYLDQPYEVIADMPIPSQLETLAISLPQYASTLPNSTITIQSLNNEPEILLYSPWTLDSTWRTESSATRVLLLDTSLYSKGAFSQNVIDSILWFAHQIPGMQIIHSHPAAIATVANKITRKSYAGISDWPGSVAPPELLYPNVEPKFYPSFSAFWKMTQNSL